MMKIGLIGCGFMGSMHANCYRALSGVKVVAVADVRRDRAEGLAALSDAEIFGEGAELIAKAEVDAVDICLPTDLHAKYAEAAMRNVPYVFVEKPATLTVGEGERLLEVQRETGANVQVGQVIRFWDEYVWLKELVDSGRYGRVRNAQFRRLSPRPDWTWENWVLDDKRSGGAAQDLHIHDVDYLLSLFGPPKKVSTVLSHGGERNSYVCSLCEYETFAATVEGGWDYPADYPFEMAFRVRFDRAVAELTNAGLRLYAEGGCTTPELAKTFVASNAAGGNISDLGGYFNELKYFTDCVRAGTRPERAGLAEAVDAVRFVRGEVGE